MLATQIHGAPSAKPPLLIAHGLFGSGRNWGVIAKRLSDSRQVITVDMRNHGASPWSDSHSYPDLAADLAAVIAALPAGTGPLDVLGHSMGGKAVMMLALEHPDLLRRLVVADIAPVAYDHTQLHLIEAMEALDLDGLSSRKEADQRLAHLVEDPTVRAFLLQSLDLPGRAWRLNLKVLAAEMKKILGFPSVTGQFGGPTLFLSGAASDYVQPAHRPLIQAHFPKARFVKIPQAGHWLHAERPRPFEAAVRAFLEAEIPDHA